MDPFEEEAVTPRTDAGFQANPSTPPEHSPKDIGGSTDNDLNEFGVQQYASIDVHPEDGAEGKVGGGEREQPPTGWTRFISLEYYGQFFGVNETEVSSRVAAALALPHRSDFLELTQANPDFYGPFWITTTLVFLCGTAGNLSNYFFSWVSDDPRYQRYFFNLEHIRQAITLLYSFLVGLPTLLYFYLKFMTEDSNKVSLPSLICLYGYSWSGLVIGLVACVLPFGLVQWLALVYGVANSVMFVMSSLRGRVGIGKQVPLWVGVGIVSFVLLLCIKWIFLAAPPAIPTTENTIST